MFSRYRGGAFNRFHFAHSSCDEIGEFFGIFAVFRDACVRTKSDIDAILIGKLSHILHLRPDFEGLFS